MQCRTIIKVHLYNSYNISYVQPLSSEISSFYKPELNDWEIDRPLSIISNKGLGNRTSYEELKLINNSLKSSIVKIRACSHFNIDQANLEIINSLNNLREC